MKKSVLSLLIASLNWPFSTNGHDKQLNQEQHLNKSIINIVEQMPELSGDDKELMDGENNQHKEEDSSKKVVNNDLTQKPQYPGGEDELYKFLKTHIKYPEEAAQNGISANVKVGFIIDQYGNLDSIHCDKEYGYGFDEEAVRLLKMMPKWIPGYHNGKAVNVKAKLPIRFVLDPATLRKQKRKNRHSLI